MDPHPQSASIELGSTSQSPPGGGQQQHLMYTEDTLQDSFHSSYIIVLPFNHLLLNTDLLFLKGVGMGEGARKKRKRQLLIKPKNSQVSSWRIW